MGLLDAIKNAFDPQRGDDSNDEARLGERTPERDGATIPDELSDVAQATAPADSETAGTEAPTHDPVVAETQEGDPAPAPEAAHDSTESHAGQATGPLAGEQRDIAAAPAGNGEATEIAPIQSPAAVEAAPEMPAVEAPAAVPAVEAAPLEREGDLVSHAPTHDAAATGAASGLSSDGSSYTVGDGDHLAWIAERVGVDADELAAANGMRRGDAVRAGQQLHIPGH